MLRHIKRIKENQLIIWLAFAFLLIIALVRVFYPVSAASVGNPYWREMSAISGYVLDQSCTTDPEFGGTTCVSTCTATTWGPFSPFPRIANGLFSNSSCTTAVPGGGHLKPVMCGSGEVMVGIRDYQHAWAVDEEHVDAYCAPVTGATVGAPAIYSPSNAYTALYGGYKEVSCPSGQVMSAVRMYGYGLESDDEFMDAGCSSFSGSFSGDAQWVSASNAFSRLEGGYKQAVCPAGQVMIGVRYYMYSSEVDDEHTDALCISLAAPPVVDVYFSMNN